MRLRSLVALIILTVVALTGSRQPTAAADAAPDASMRMFREPAAGAAAPSAATLQAESASAAEPQPAAEEPVNAPAGGVKVNLRGSHRPAVVRYANPGSPPVHECVDTAAGNE